MVYFDKLEGIGIGRIRAFLEYSALFCGVFLRNCSHGVYLQVWKGTGEKRVRCVPWITSFNMIFVNHKRIAFSTVKGDYFLQHKS